MALADDLAVDDLLLVPAGDETAVLEAGHELVERGPALAHAGGAQMVADDTPGRGAACEAADDEVLQVREARNRH